MEYNKILDSLKLYGTTKEDIIKRRGYDGVLENVVVAPWWEYTMFENYSDSIKQVSDKVYNIYGDGFSFTFIAIRNMGASALIEEVLALGVSNCKRILFIGSAGSIDETINIGDLIIPKCSYNGVGATRYLNEELKDDFEEIYYSSETFNQALISVMDDKGYNNKLVVNYSVDTIIAQFPHIKHISDLNVNTIEMETSALFKCASMMGLEASALFVISDNTIKNKSLYSGRQEEDSKRKKIARKEMVPQIVVELFKKYN